MKVNPEGTGQMRLITIYNKIHQLSLLPTQICLHSKREVLKILFGSKLRNMRKGAGMSQEDIALELHMSISNVSRLETDKYELKAADLLRWGSATNNQEVIAAMILGIDVGVLQQAMDLISTTSKLVGMILLGGIL